MELVDRDENSGVIVGGDLSEFHEESGEIGREIPRVGWSIDRVDVDAQLGSVRQTDTKGPEHTQCSADPFADSALGVHRQQDPSEG